MPPKRIMQSVSFAIDHVTSVLKRELQSEYEYLNTCVGKTVSVEATVDPNIMIPTVHTKLRGMQCP